MSASEVLRRAKERCLGEEKWDLFAALIAPGGGRIQQYGFFQEACGFDTIWDWLDSDPSDEDLSQVFDRAIALAEEVETQ